MLKIPMECTFSHNVFMVWMVIECNSECWQSDVFSVEMKFLGSQFSSPLQISFLFSHLLSD